MPFALPSTSSVMHPELRMPYRVKSPLVPQVWMVMPLADATLPKPLASSSLSSSVIGNSSGMLRSSFL